MSEETPRANSKPNLPDYKVEYYVDANGKRRKKIKKLVKKEKELSEEQLEEIKSAFELFDKDGSGNIDIHELRDAMKALGVYLNKEKVKAVMKDMDADGSGTVEFDEFKQLMKVKIKERNSEEELRRSFRIYDEDDTGKISFADLKRVAQELKADLTDDEIKGMIYEADRDRDGEVSCDEFLRIMRKAKLM
ncbi:UNKNOWN [Stylonychia lemnae]|uniref:EF-hand domain-containing protein n=1 Tax=Stylonychia lemnae TaxID=5949 RepID=A0A078AV38_STYLE|nr:UNKNOWN [Stylonychia lemnae]|eukprot:CDW86069.1 UNKNOWN [Stylonychia lemnae]